MRFHVLGIPHTISTPEYSSCAFTQKVVKLCKMLTMEGHEVFHYGHSQSKVSCTENVVCTTPQDLKISYPGHDWRKSGFPDYKLSDHCYQAFYCSAKEEIGRRKQPGDFLLCPFGMGHKAVADAHQDMLVVESGIGYPHGTFAPYRVFESYAIMHAYQGTAAAIDARNDFWYDAVIPNSFDLDEFDFSDSFDLPDDEGYFLFLGRQNSGKGLHIAKQIAETTKTKLVVAGPGPLEMPSEFVQPLGVVGPARRRKLLSQATATICASTFLEPFCGVQIESMLSGTPVVSSDWGAFAEYNVHGQTGYRCKTFEQFVWAANNIGGIKRQQCRNWAMNFSLEKIAPMYSDYFRSLQDIYGGKGWYETRTDRQNLSTSSF